MIVRDSDGVAHVVALSGGHDSTSLAFELKERNPNTPYNYLCTPTGDELPEMFEFWRWLGSDNALGRRLIPIMNGTLKSVIEKQGTLPNHRMRFCTRILKIEPYRKFLKEETQFGPVVSYVGLRADEPGRAGGAYDDIEGVDMRFPLREWGWGEAEVQDSLARRDIVCPDRTDCARCYHQRIGEWWLLWKNHIDIFEDAVADEKRFGATYRTPGRDSWPTSLDELANDFEMGAKPTASLKRMVREQMEAGACRVCRM